jgi:hypothetical protein
MSTVTFDVVRASTKYVVDENGDLSQVAANTPAFEYNADGTYKGMLVEEERENGIRNSEAGGSTNGVIGSGGALPTNWGTAGLNGIAVEIIGTGTEKGVEYVDIKFSGTATSTGQFSLRFDSISQITAAQNEFWSSSVFMKYTDQTDNPESVSLGIQQFDSTPTFLAVDSQTITLTNTLTRYKYENVEIDNASTASIINTVFFGITNTETYNFTVRFGLPQLEEGAHASSVIKTSGTSVTRNKDDISNTSASTYIGTAGTIYAEVQIDNILNENQWIIYARSTTAPAENYIHMFLSSSGNFGYRLAASNVVQGTHDETATTGNHKLAIVYTTGDIRYYLDGVQVGTDANAFTFAQTLSEIYIGKTPFSSTDHFNNWIRAFAFYKRALTDSEAIALTS